MSKHPLYDTAVSEVRGEASEKEKLLLQSDVEQWRDALQSVVDEVDAQLIVETDKFDDSTRNLTPGSADYETALEAFETWKSRVRIFKKHISARLIAVKRMCQEEAESGANYDSLAARIVAAAVELWEIEQADEEAPSIWDGAFDRLMEAVQDFQSSDR